MMRLSILIIFGVFAMIVIAQQRDALAHDSADWIRQQGLKNKFNEFCCGVNDCNPVDPENVKVGIGGYIVHRQPGGSELIPYSEPQPFSIDGRLWICRKPDGSRRCVFDRPPGM